MKERIGALIGGVVEGMQWLGTFHSIGARMLRRHAELAGLKSNFTILDSDDQLRLMKQLIEAEGVDEKRWPTRTLAAMIDGWKNRGLRPDDLSDSEGQGYAFGKGKLLYRQYQERLKSLNAVLSVICCWRCCISLKAILTSWPITATASATCWWMNTKTPTWCNIPG